MPLLAQSIGLDTLSKYFHLPINDVAKELGVCATVLKKICRKNGIPRWPHRKIKSLDKMITTLEVSVAKNPEDEERIRQEIQTLKNKRLFLMKNPNVLAAKPPNMKKTAKPPGKRANTKTFEMNSNPSLVLNPMAAALYSQLTHPHIPQPLPLAAPVAATPITCPTEALQWVPGDHPSAFIPTKTLRLQQLQQQQLQHSNVTFVTATSSEGIATCEAAPQERAQQRMVVSPATEEARTVPERLEYPIHLPELRLSEDGDKPKLATLEPELFPVPKNTQSPKKEPQPSLINNKWQLPEWFEDEHKQIMLKCDGSIAECDAIPVPHTEDPITDTQVPTSLTSSLETLDPYYTTCLP